MRRLRQSGVTALDDCQRRAWYDQVDPTSGTSDAAAFGTGYHAGMEHFYGLRRDNPEVPLDKLVTPEHTELYADSAVESFHEATEAAGDLMRWNDYGGHETADPVLRNAVRAYFNGGHYWPERIGDGLIKVEAVELRFDLPEQDWLPRGWSPSGTGDLLLSWWPDALPEAASPAHFYAEDHKTAGKAWPLNKAEARKAFQPTWYAPPMLDAMGRRYGFEYTVNDLTWTFGVMRRDGQKFQRLETPITEEDIRRSRMKAAMAAEHYDRILAMPNGPAGNPTSNYCSRKFCNHWDVCPWGDGPVTETPVFMNQHKETDNDGME